MAQFKDLLIFGTAKVLDSVYATKFIGNLEGTADRAVSDNLGQQIDSTYIKSISPDSQSSTITITYGDGTTSTFNTYNSQVTVVDDLSTQSATSALSANQGVVIDGRLTALETAATWSTF